MRRTIIDGYNLLFSSERYAAIARRDIEAARERLIADLGARAAEGEDVVLVFDGAGNPDSDGSPSSAGGVTVVFSPYGTDADSYIEMLAAQTRQAGDEATVVTSDGATRDASAGGSVSVVSVRTFARDLTDDEGEWREQAGGPRRRTTIGDTLSDATRTGLLRLQRGKPPFSRDGHH